MTLKFSIAECFCNVRPCSNPSAVQCTCKSKGSCHPAPTTVKPHDAKRPLLQATGSVTNGNVGKFTSRAPRDGETPSSIDPHATIPHMHDICRIHRPDTQPLETHDGLPQMWLPIAPGLPSNIHWQPSAQCATSTVGLNTVTHCDSATAAR